MIELGHSLCHFDRLLPTICYRPSAATEDSAIKSSTIRCPTAYYTDRVLLPSVLPPTVLLYLTTPIVCFFITVSTTVTVTAITAAVIISSLLLS